MANPLTDLGDTMERRRQLNANRAARGKTTGRGPTTGKTRMSGVNRTPANDTTSSGSAQTRTADRVSASNTGGKAGALSAGREGRGIGRLARGAGKLGKFAAGKGNLAVGAGKTALDLYNTPTSETAKLTGIPEAYPSPDQPVGQQIKGFAANTLDRTAGGLYELGQNTGVVPAIDALPGTNLPRFEHGKYVPGDQVDEHTLGGLASGVVSGIAGGLSGLNRGYRKLAGYDAPDAAAQPNEAAPDGGQQLAQDAEGEQAAPAGQVTGFARQAAVDATEPDLGAPQAQPRQQPVAAPEQVPNAASFGDGTVSDTPNLTIAGGPQATRRYQAFIDQHQAADDRRLQEQVANADIRRQRFADNAARSKENERQQAVQKIKNSIAYRFGGDKNGVDGDSRPAHQAAIANLAELTNGSNAAAQSVPVRRPSSADPAKREASRLAMRRSRLALDESQRKQAMQQQIATLSQSNPELADQLAQTYRSLYGDGSNDRFVKGQQVVTTDADGNPLLKPITADVTYDTRTGKQYGGAGTGAGKAAGNGKPGKAEWVNSVLADPRNQAKGVTKAQAEHEYEQKYGK